MAIPGQGVHAQATNQQAASVLRPAYQVSRENEDWSAIRQSGERDWWDAAKFVPIRDRAEWYISFGGEWRPSFEIYRNEEFGAQVTDGNGYFLNRLIGHADTRLGRHARLFVQLQSGLEHGRTGGPRPPDEDRLDLLQGFVDVTAGSATRGVTWRIGRQELQYGAGRLFGLREGPNVRYGHDGARMIIRQSSWRLDAFVARPVRTTVGVFDDSANLDHLSWGVHADRPFTTRAAGVDLYYFGLDRRRARFNQGAGAERRHTAGTRVWRTMPRLAADAEFAWQLGTFGQGNINAWTLSTTTAYLVAMSSWRPRVALSTGIASGDSDPADPDLQSFHPLFPRGSYFGLGAAQGAINIAGLQPRLSVQPTNRLTLAINTFVFWRHRLQDGLYSVPGTLLRPSGSSARYIGAQPELELRWVLNRHAVTAVNLARFVAGRFLRETPPGRHTTFIATSMTYRF